MSLARYVEKKKGAGKNLLHEIVKSKVCYLFLAPYAIVFALFVVAPLIVSIFYSFTYYNILEPPKFIGLQNYINLLLADDVFLIAVKNTFIMAAITGPIGYLMSFLFAWFIHELPRYVRAFVTLVFYAPSISGAVYVIWAIIFSGDAYGYINGLLMQFGLIDGPILWLTDPKYMMPVVLVVIVWLSLGSGFLSFVAGLNTVDETLYEAGLIDGIKNRWQELWYITLPNMKGMLLFGAVMAITQSFGVADVTTALCGFPSTDYAVHTVVNHLVDYGSIRFEMGYASAIATLLFFIMILCNKLVQKALSKVGD
ncbi:MAG: sugar ABC transporter permease [Spirochaetaceae bacterium]|jgi:multiple sugar transport system permease protein|nr:sugar ABC transporter permease [Spirochaetaceae bacterium]